MSSPGRREVLADGTVVLHGERCAFHYQRPRAGVVLLRIVGKRLDTGELGRAPMDELAADVARGSLELFIDLSAAAGAVVAVQEGWADWFASQRASLARVDMLVAGPYLHFTVELAKFFSRTGELIRVYLDAGEFAAAFTRASENRR